jgi:hypothetical protein
MKRSENVLVENELFGDQKVNLGFFISEKAGVCRHRSLFAGAVLERMIGEGLIEGGVTVQRNGISGVGGHGWALYTNSRGEDIVIDAMQGFVGSPSDGRAYWDYRNGAELCPSSPGDTQQFIVPQERIPGSVNPDKRPEGELKVKEVALQIDKMTLAVRDSFDGQKIKQDNARIHTTAGGHSFIDWGNMNGVAESPALIQRARHQVDVALRAINDGNFALNGIRHTQEQTGGVSFIRLNNGSGNTRVLFAQDPKGVVHVVGAYTHGDGLNGKNDYDMVDSITRNALSDPRFRSVFGLELISQPKRSQVVQ